MRKFVLIAALVPATWLGAACRDSSEPGTTDGGTDATPTGSDTGDSSAHAIRDAYQLVPKLGYLGVCVPA